MQNYAFHCFGDSGIDLRWPLCLLLNMFCAYCECVISIKWQIACHHLVEQYSQRINISTRADASIMGFRSHVEWSAHDWFLRNRCCFYIACYSEVCKIHMLLAV